MLLSAAKYGLISVESIKDIVRLVEWNTVFDLLDDAHQRKQSAKKLLEKKEWWPSELCSIDGFLNMQIEQ